MAFTQSDIDAFKVAMAASKGALSIEFGDQKLVFRSMDDMEAYLRMMQRDVAAAAGTPRTRYAAYSKGV